jgi:ABC-2 type transport system ATP-binding protein
MTTPTADPPAGGATIVLDCVSKWYGNVVAVNEVSLEVRPGVTGLLGPNGAGKTTLLHVMTGQASPSQGEVRVFGERARDNHGLYRRMGVLSEHEAVYGFYTGRQFVEFSARMQGLSPVAPAVDRAIRMSGLEDAQGRALTTYSRGMRQRMRLAASLVHDPELLVLDEPLNGMDPRQRLEFQDLMQALAQEGRTILISSHVLEEVETLAESILLMVRGKLAAAGDFHAIREKLDERPYKVRIEASDARTLAAGLVAMEEVDSVAVDPDGALIVLSRDVRVLQYYLPRLARARGVRLRRVEPLDESLESVFSYVVSR